METTFTAFPQAEEELKKLAHMPIDAKSFLRPMKRCQMNECKGTCCYDGIYLEKGEDKILENIAARERDFFKGIGLNLPDKVVTEGKWMGGAPEKKTAIGPRAFSSTVRNFPDHFNDTACVFLKENGQCGLQALAEAQGKHPWFYKPLGCWLHPVSVELKGKDIIVLEDEKTDSCLRGDYDGYVTRTPCGATCKGGEPAYEVLKEELDFLGKILSRDLVEEIKNKLAN